MRVRRTAGLAQTAAGRHSASRGPLSPPSAIFLFRHPLRRPASAHGPTFVAYEGHGGGCGALEVGGQHGDAQLASVEAVWWRVWSVSLGGRVGGGAVGGDAGARAPRTHSSPAPAW